MMSQDWQNFAWMWPWALIGLLLVLGGAALGARTRRLGRKAAVRPTPAPALEPNRAAVRQAPASTSKAPLAETPPAEPVPREKDAQLDAGLSRTRASLWGRMAQILGQSPQVDEAVFDALEEVLLTSDVGVTMTLQLMTALREAVGHTAHTPETLRDLLRGQLRTALMPSQAPGDPLARADQAERRPRVILFVGVNGVGKTTTIGKLAQKLRAEGQKVVLAAGDTFRAAAAEQLAVWGERTGARVVRGAERQDPASVMFSAMRAAQADDADIVLADTAGRLHTNVELMEEIKKARRALGKVRPGAPDETWLVVDATTGQNALHQAKEFHEALGLTGIILTKLDGTAKGGIVVAIAASLGLAVRFIGVGEGADALRPFDAEDFVQALL